MCPIGISDAAPPPSHMKQEWVQVWIPKEHGALFKKKKRGKNIDALLRRSPKIYGQVKKQEWMAEGKLEYSHQFYLSQQLTASMENITRFKVPKSLLMWPLPVFLGM